MYADTGYGYRDWGYNEPCAPYIPDCSHIHTQIPGAVRVEENKEGPFAYIAYVNEIQYLNGPEEINGQHIIYRLIPARI